MSIPKDEIDKASIITPTVDPALTSSEDGPVVVDGKGNEADPNFIKPVQVDNSNEDPVMLASASGKFGGKAGKVVTDAVNKWTDTFGGTDAIIPPDAKKTKAKPTLKGDSPVSTVDTEGGVVIRPMSMDELNSVREYMKRDDINFDVVLPNLEKISSDAKFKVKGEDGTFKLTTKGDRDWETQHQSLCHHVSCTHVHY